MTTTFREIHFENNSPKVCYSGQSLKGLVNIYFPIDTHVKGEDFLLFCVSDLTDAFYSAAIYVTFFGKGFCQWSDSGDGEPVTGSKTYLDVRADLLPNNANGSSSFFIL